MTSLLLPLIAVASAAPTPLTATHQRDIGCVTFLAMIADEQRRQVPGSNALPAISEPGARYAGIVGERVMRETGQPRALVQFAIERSYQEQSAAFMSAPDPTAMRQDRWASCYPLMQAELAAADVELVATPAAPAWRDYLDCAARLALAADAVRASEGFSERAQTLGSSAKRLTGAYFTLRYDAEPSHAALVQWDVEERKATLAQSLGEMDADAQAAAENACVAMADY